MQLTIFDMLPEDSPPSSSEKTSPASSVSRTTPSGLSSQDWREKIPPSLRLGGNGRTRVWLLDPKEQSRGGFSMPNISAWPNDAAVCSLSQVLKRGSIPPRFFLSSKACAGILRRAAKRGKSLPPSLHAALRAAALGQISIATVE